MIFFRPRVVLTLLAALFALAFPAAASAALYQVNTVADETDKAPGAPCETDAGAGVCSLRAAIEVANGTVAVADSIGFDLTVFQGQLLDTIQPSTPFETITSPLEINGATCGTAAGVTGPCVGISGPNGSTAFSVAAENSSIYGLAIATASTGIRVEAKKFIARGNWFGVNLDGGLGAQGSFGIAVSPNADEATIGGKEVVHRNVFANSTTGLQLRGASKAVVQGNYFGVKPDGVTAAANTRNLVVADSTGPLPDGTPAKDNLIGADVETGTATAACDLGCNVFVSASSSDASIDLQGSGAFEEKGATGPTAIEGNYVGMNANGEVASTAAEEGIRVGTAGEVTIGSEDAGGGNWINGGNYAVFAGLGGVPARKLSVLGNMIGRSRDNSGPSFMPREGIAIFSSGITAEADAARIEGNRLSAEDVGIEANAAGATIADNRIEAGFRGIWARGDTEGPGFGNLIEGNTITGALQHGIFIQNDLNLVLGNEITGNGTGIGIENFLTLDSSENVIGGDGAGEGNVISGSEFSAIEIIDVEGSQNEVGRNSGSGNGAKFIRLKAANPGTEPVGPNGGIKPPVVATASKTEASGTAVAGAVVRVFSKTSSQPGELGTYLGKVTAGSGGEWKLTYLNPVAGGSLVAATQTNEDGGTSEVGATASVPADPSSGGGGSGGSGGNNNGSPTIPDTIAPKATIKKAPKAKSASTTAKFKFKSNEAGSKFQCKLDKGKFKNCKSPKTYKKLKPGKHVFKVRAIDKAGNVGKPAKRKFTVLAS